MLKLQQQGVKMMKIFTDETISKIEEIRVLPLSKEEFNSINLVVDFLEIQLPARNNKFYYKRHNMITPTGSLILFQYDGKIVGYAIFKNDHKLLKPDTKGFTGYYQFSNDSIHVLKQHITNSEMQETFSTILAQGTTLISKHHLQQIIELLEKNSSNNCHTLCIDLDTILNKFEYFCQTPGISSGKATSYKKAIKYLCDFLNIDNVSLKIIKQIQDMETQLLSQNTIEYNKLLVFLQQRKQSSYLEKGFINAALPYFYKFIQSLDLSQNKTTPILFANVTWMKYYNGLEEFSNKGASYVREHNDAYEKYNFREVDGMYYGFLQCNNNNKINIERIANTYNCQIKEEDGNKYIDNTTIVFFSTPPQGISKIIGVYKNAKIYENYQTNSYGNIYNLSCNSEDGILLPIERRTFEIPKVHNSINLYGQDQRWYADKPEQQPFVNTIKNYLEELYTDTEINLEEINEIKNEQLIIKELSDKQIAVEFNPSMLKNTIPLHAIKETQNKHKNYGTSKISRNKIVSGRSAEKYFISFLKHRGFKENVEFQDVSNSTKYPFDMIFSNNIGLEVKNIKSGSFYLTDNEIYQLENKLSHLILVAIDNGIWLLKNKSGWLQDTIKNIKTIKENCLNKYSNIEIGDLKININEHLVNDKELYEISTLNYSEILKIILS